MVVLHAVTFEHRPISVPCACVVGCFASLRPNGPVAIRMAKIPLAARFAAAAVRAFAISSFSASKPGSFSNSWFVWIFSRHRRAPWERRLIPGASCTRHQILVSSQSVVRRFNCVGESCAQGSVLSAVSIIIGWRSITVKRHGYGAVDIFHVAVLIFVLPGRSLELEFDALMEGRSAITD